MLHALTRGERKITTEALFMALILERRAVSAHLLARMGVTPGQAHAWLEHEVGRPAQRVAFDHLAPYSARLQAAIGAAASEAAGWGTTLITTGHLLIGILREPQAERGAAAGFLRRKGITVERLRTVLRAVMQRSTSTEEQDVDANAS
jgi:ATP-dependent Clp protease ATP-binding subunit ClpA